MDGSGGVYLASTSNAPWTGPGATEPLNAWAGAEDMVVVRLDSDGTYRWHTFYGGSGLDGGAAIAVDGRGGLYLAGYSYDTWMGPGETGPLNAWAGPSDIVVVKVDSAGAYRWHTFYGSSSDDAGYGIAVDGRGGVYLAGSGAATWTGPEGQAPLNAFAGVDDIVMVRLDGDGAYRWHTFYGGSSTDAGFAIAVDGSGLYAAGFSAATWTGPGGRTPFNAFAGGTEMVVVKTVVTTPEMAVLGNGLEIVAGSASPSPGNHTDFGSLLLGQALTRTFTISNSGISNLHLTGSPVVTITGPAAADFSVVGQPATPVAANDTTTFQVQFSPSLTGTRVATLTIASDDNENPYAFAIGGVGSVPTVSLSVSAGSGSEAAQTGITVTATASVNVSGTQTVVLGVSGTGLTAGDYSLSSAVMTILDGQSSGSVTFTVQDDALDEPDEIATLTLSSPSSGLSLGAPISQTVTIVDNDGAGYLFTPTGFSLAEGSSQVVSLTLATQPTAAVTITLTSSDPSECSVAPASVTLNAVTWQGGASFTISGLNDGLGDGDQPCTIVTTASTADGVYRHLDPADVSLTVIDSQRLIYLPLVLNNFSAVLTW